MTAFQVHRFAEEIVNDSSGRILMNFCANYHYFSFNQIIAFKNILNIIPHHDYDSISLLGEVIYDELGNGNPLMIHSFLFKKFCRSIGFGNSFFEKDVRISNGTLKYISLLQDIFSSGNIVKAAAGYVYLEQSAVETYPILLKVFKNIFPKLSDNDMLFFILHADLEKKHLSYAKEMANRYIKEKDDEIVFKNTINALNSGWAEFWFNIVEDYAMEIS